MCRLFAITSQTPLSPMVAINALNVMKEGHDASGVGLMLRDLGGPFASFKNAPILSGIFTNEGLKQLDYYMMDIGFRTQYKFTIKPSKTPHKGIPHRDIYLVRAYEYPEEWENWPESKKQSQLINIRLILRHMGDEKKDMIVFSFWPDVILLKELGDPMHVAEHLGLIDSPLEARIIMAQGRQNTNYAINLYACHPFFIEGCCSMTNGENTAFTPIREYLESRGIPGYSGYQSDSEVFAHILHYTTHQLGLEITAYKHIITPLKEDDLNPHPQRDFLRHLKQTCRQLIIDGPNCVIGSLPDHSLFMVQDRKKLRPGVVGGKPGVFAFSSEMCGLDAALPDRDPQNDFQPMHLDTVLVSENRRELTICSQTDLLPLKLSA